MLFTYLHEIGGGTGELSLRFTVLLLPVFFLYFTVISVYYRDNGVSTPVSSWTTFIVVLFN